MSVKELELFIDTHYKAMSGEYLTSTPQQQQTGTETNMNADADMESQSSSSLSLPPSLDSQTNGNGNEDTMKQDNRTNASKKRKVFTSPLLSSPVFDASDSQLTASEEKIRDAVLATMASWMGEMQYTMQQSFNTQFERAVAELKNDVINEINEGGTADPSSPPLPPLPPPTSFDLTNSVINTAESVHDLEKENSELREKCRILEGRLTRAEKEIEEVKEQQLMQEARSMRDNLVFFNVPEQRSEDCEKTLRNFLATEMKIVERDMEKIRFDRVHRTSQHQNGRHRVIVAKFNPYEGRQIVINHIKHLDRDKNFGVNEQLPRQLSERKKQLLPTYKDAKQAKKNVKWSLDKLIIEGKEKAVQKDSIKNINLDSTEKSLSLRVRHSPLHTLQGSSFKGHSVSVEEQDDIVPALHAVYADYRVARAAHNVYA
jgi:hypothetical protein